MGLLGTVGYLYLTLLAFLLIIGFGLVGLQLITYLFISTDKNKSKGAKQNSPWYRLILISLLSIVLMITLILISNPWYQTGSNHHF